VGDLMDEMQMRTQLDAIGLTRISDRLVSLSRPAIHLYTTTQSDDRIVTGVSKLGGSPDLPSMLAWPTWHDKPQGFIAQLNLADIAPYAPSHILPARGMLYFFYDLWEQPWGFDPKDRGGGRVIYFDGDVAQLRRRPAPPGPHDPEYATPFTACEVTCSSVLRPPSWFSTRLDSLALTQEEQKRYSEWWFDSTKDSAPCHQLLGLPCLIQNDMEIECQFVSNGVYMGDLKGRNDPRHDHLKAAAPDWRLLLQVDSDDSSGMMWGDGGMIYYWIRKQDLAAGIFEHTWLVLQCS
ncbi:MAG: YwqG family protein, partial [Chloroflexota bacterium]